MKRRMPQKTEASVIKNPPPWQNPNILHWLNALVKTPQLWAVNC